MCLNGLGRFDQTQKTTLQFARRSPKANFWWNAWWTWPSWTCALVKQLDFESLHKSAGQVSMRDATAQGRGHAPSNVAEWHARVGFCGPHCNEVHHWRWIVRSRGQTHLIPSTAKYEFEKNFSRAFLEVLRVREWSRRPQDQAVHWRGAHRRRFPRLRL